MIEKAIISLLLAGAVLYGAYWKGVSDERGKNERAIMVQAQENAKTIASIEGGYLQEISRLERLNTDLRGISSGLGSASCVLGGDFRLFHDEATGQLPRGAGKPNDTPVAVKDLADTIADNYTICNENTSKLRALQSWVVSIYE